MTNFPAKSGSSSNGRFEGGYRSPDEDQRSRVTEKLCEHFAAGQLELEELERRLAAVETGASSEALNDLIADLPVLGTAASPEGPPSRESRLLKSVSAFEVPARGWTLALLGGNSRGGHWTPPRRVHAVALMGAITLDFTSARLGPGVTEVAAVALMGAIEIIVPQGLSVEVQGVGILGSVDHVVDPAGRWTPSTPVLLVTARACMGGVFVKCAGRGGRP